MDSEPQCFLAVTFSDTFAFHSLLLKWKSVAENFALVLSLCANIVRSSAPSFALSERPRERLMRRKLVFALILLSLTLSQSACVHFWAVGPPCIGNGCPAGSGGQLGPTKQAQNRPARDGKVLAGQKGAADPSHANPAEDDAGQLTAGE
jgi:hypothetical protein